MTKGGGGLEEAMGRMETAVETGTEPVFADEGGGISYDEGAASLGIDKRMLSRLVKSGRITQAPEKGHVIQESFDAFKGYMQGRKFLFPFAKKMEDRYGVSREYVKIRVAGLIENMGGKGVANAISVYKTSNEPEMIARVRKSARYVQLGTLAEELDLSPEGINDRMQKLGIKSGISIIEGDRVPILNKMQARQMSRYWG